jgi:hypothetical protein
MAGSPQPGATAGAAPGAGSTVQPPAAAPFSKPQDKQGLKAAARTNLHIALNMLEEALPAFGGESPEGQKISRMIGELGKLFGKHDDSDLVPAEIMHMVRQLPQMGGGTDVQRKILQQMQQQQPAPQGPAGA